MEKKKKWIIWASAILLCVAVGVSALVFFLTRGEQDGKDPQTEELEKEPEVDVEALVAEGRFPASVLWSIAKPVKNNDLTDSTPMQELQNTGIKYTFDTDNVLKSAYVNGIALEAEKYDTMAVRLRSLSQDEIPRFQLYLLTDQGGSLVKDPVADTKGKNAHLITVGEADADGWITVRIVVKGLEEWSSATTIKGFNFGWVTEGSEQEISAMVFSLENVKVEPVTAGEWEEGYFPAERLYEAASPVYSNKAESTSKIKVELLSTGLKYSWNQLHITGLKSMWVQELDLDTKKYDTMTVKLRCTDKEAYSRWRLYLVSDREEDLTSDPVADSQNTPGLFEAGEPDADGWVLVTVNLTKLFRWNNSDTIRAFNFGFVNAGPNHEIAYVRFDKMGSGSSSGKPVTDGQFPADVLYEEGYPVYNKNTATTPYVGATLQGSGVKYTWGSGHTSGLKSVYVDNVRLDTGQFDTMTIRLRSLDKGEFTLYRLYLLTDTAGDLSNDTQGVVVNGKGTVTNMTVSEADAQGWITVKIDVGNIALWKNSNIVKGFNFGWVNTGFVQEIAEIRFTKKQQAEEPKTEEPRAEKPDPVLVTDGRFPAEILYANARPVWNNDTDSTAKLGEELLSTGVKYDFTGYRITSKKCIYVESMELKPADYDTMTVRVRSLDGTAFDRYCLYILGQNGGSLGNKTKGMAVDSVELNQDKVMVGEADADGWITVKYDLEDLELWKNAGTVKGFSFTYVNTGARQELAEIRFTKEKQSEDPKKELSEEEKRYIAAGVFDAKVLYAAGRPVWNNDLQDTEPAQKLEGDRVIYTFREGLALKSVYVNGVELNPKEFGKLVIRIRSLTENEFERFRLYLVTDKGGSLTKNPVIDTIKNINGDRITVSKADTDGWIDVSIDLDGFEPWIQAETVTGFSFGYVNEGSVQEVASIRFCKKGGTFGASALYILGRPVSDNKSGTTANLTEKLLDTGVKYDFTKGERATALKSVVLENIALDTGAYDTMTVKIRSLDGKSFDRWRLYLLTDQGGSLFTNSTGMVLDSNNLNKKLITISEPDDQGWLTVTIDVGSTVLWKNGNTVTGVNFGYVNKGNLQEVAEISFVKAKVSLAARIGKLLGSFGIVGRISPAFLPKYFFR